MDLPGQAVVNPYDDPNSLMLPGLMVKGPWSERLAAHVHEQDIRALYFNNAKGWRGSDFGFLASVPEVEEVDIITAQVHNLRAVEELRQLRQLSVTGVVNDEVDFTKLGRLESCYLYWWRGAESIFGAPALTRAYFDRIAIHDWQQLARLTSVRMLTIANSTVPSLEWLDELKLRELHLINCRKIGEFGPIGRQLGLERLTISGSKQLHELGFLSSLKALQVLNLSDSHTLRSLAPLAGLKELRAFAFAGNRTRVEDGDLTSLTKLPKLAMLMFAPRREYSHRLIKKWDWFNFDQPDRLLVDVREGDSEKW